MTELSLYTFLESIVDVIPTIQNRFLVVEGGVGDLNADNSDDAIIGNSVNQTDWKKKYPCAVLMPPREVGRNKQKLTTRFQLTMYFLTTTYADGMNATKSINVQTNTSKVSIKEDWSQMKSVAEDFMATMNNQFYTDLTILDYIRPVKSNEETYDRVTMVNNDRLSGIRLTFELDLVIGCSAGSGNDPEWTPPVSNPSCGVCSPGEVGQVWTTINDNTVGWQTPSGGGGGGGGSTVVVLVNSNYSALAAANTTYILFVTAAAVITLPTAIGNTCRYLVKKKTATGISTSVIFTAGQNADGSTTINLVKQYEALEFIPDGSNYGIF